VGDRIGFIGLGIMGKPMATNLLAAGISLTVHSRSPGPVDALVDAGATPALGPAEVAAGTADHDASRHPEVEPLLTGAGGILRARRPARS
jgi:3-hydroxyisobutyrate dehydrogenase-like beta-hydroxyacid dehydrogenase